MPFEHWFAGEIRTTEPITRDTLVRIADRIGFPIEGRGGEGTIIWSRDHRENFNDQFFVNPCSVRKNMLDVTMYYNSEFDLKKVASIFEEEFNATSGRWLLVGKWGKFRPVSEIVGACDCPGNERYLCADCLKAWPPVNASGQEITFSLGTGNACRIKDTGAISEDPIIYVNGVKCRALEHRFSGIRIMRCSDRRDMHREEVEELKKKHAREIEDEAKDFDRIREWHGQYAACRLKELEDLNVCE